MTENSDKPVALKPCPTPWCNGNVTQFTEPTYCEIPVPCGPRCRQCGVSAPNAETWNRRPASAGQSEEVVERVARAICTAEGFEPDRRNARGVINWVSYKPAASAALSALDLPAIQREARKEEVVELIARIIDPSSWRVMDGYLEDTKRKYRGQNVGWPSDQFQHKESMAKAREILSALDLPTIQRDARREGYEQAMAEAARECERMDDAATYDDETDEGRMYGAGYQEATGKCAAAIRALKEGTGE